MNWKWGLFAALVVALGLRLLGLRYGLPYVYNPDEVAIMSRALAFAKGDLNPHNFLYPTLYFYVLFAWEGLTALLAVATRAVASFADFQRGFFLDPTRVYVAGRLLTALLGTATVAATWALARRLAGSIAGLAAALVVAVSPLHVRDSHYVKHDVPVTLLIVLAYLAYDRLWNKEGSLVLAAVVTGLAFSTHYYTIFLSIPLAWSAAHTACDRGDAVKRILQAATISAAVFFVCSPFILAEPHTALRDMHANRQIVVDRAVASLGYAATLVRYGVMLFRDTVGRPLAIFVAVGILVGAIREREKTRLLLAFCVPFFLFIATTYPASRYLIPLVPFGAVFSGIAAAWWAESTQRRDRLALVVVFGIGVLLAFGESLQVDLFIRQADTRTLAARYIDSQVPAGSTVLTQPYSVPIEPTADVLREAVERSGRDMPTKTRLQLERSPYPSPAYRVLYLGHGLDADKIYLPYDALGGAGGLNRLRAEHVAFVVLKRYNGGDPNTLPLFAALAREGRRVAVFSPYRDAGDGSDGSRPEPFLHNTDARIDGALERPGPLVEIWQVIISGPRS
jgi:Dolichyl-phosphate-mannose-protein mannosyltransferase